MLLRLLSTIVLICLFLFSNHLKSQDFYIIDTVYAPPLFAETSRKIINLNTCELSTTTSDFNPLIIAFRPLDMTITGESGISIPVSLFIDYDPIINNVPENVIVYNFWSPFITPGIGPIFTPEVTPKGIATDYNFESYLIGDYLSHVDDINDVVTPLGMLPLLQRPKGQMTYREGSFYYPSINNELIQLKTSGTGPDYWIRSLGNLPDTLNYGGIFSIPFSCDSTDTYLIHHDPNRGSTLYHLDIPSVTLTEHCTMPHKPSAAAYDGENTLPDCNNYVLDLDINNSVELNRYDSICTGTISLLDNEIQLSPDLEFDSITITLQNSMDTPNELLSVTATHPEVIIAGQNSEHITLSSTGFTKADPLLEVLASLSYTNNNPTLGQRIIEVTSFHPHYGSVTAFIYLEATTTGNASIAAVLNEPNCFGNADGSISLNITGTTTYDLSWEDGDTAAIHDNLSMGTYNYQLTDDAGCSYNDVIFLDQPDTLSLTITALQDSICGPNGALTGIPVGGTSDYSFSWSSGDNTSTANMLTSGTYDLEVLDANNCVANASYTLYSTTTAEGELIEFACLGETLTVNGQSFNQDTTLQQLLTTPAGCDSLLDVQLTFFDTFYSYSAFEPCPGESISLYDLFIQQDTNLLVTFQTVNGCDSVEHYEINFQEPPITSLEAYVCEGETYQFAGEILTAAGVYYDTLTAASGCDSLLELSLFVHPLPEITIQQNGSLCNGEEMTLGVSSSFTNIIWSNGTTANDLLINAPGDYAVSVVDDNGCQATAAISITDSPPEVIFEVQNPACPDGVGQLIITTISGGITPYLISETGQVVQAGEVVDNLSVGNYNYTLEDAEGCATNLDFEITAQSILEVDLPQQLTIKLGESIQIPVITSFQPSFISWSPSAGLDCLDCLMPIASPTETTRYFLQLVDENNCDWEGSALVQVTFPGIYIPNAFSPNADGRNDVFAPALSDAVATISDFSVFDRWGAQVFARSAGRPGWDGRMNGDLAPPGIYVYLIEWIDLAGNNRKETGEVLLLR